MRKIHNDDSIDVFEDSTSTLQSPTKLKDSASKTPSESPTKSMELGIDFPQTHKSRTVGHRRSSSITDASGKVSPLHKRAMSLHYVPLPKVQEVTNPSKKGSSEISVQGQEVTTPSKMETGETSAQVQEANNPTEKEIGETTIQIADLHQETAQL